MTQMRGRASNLHGTWADVVSVLQVNWTVIFRALLEPCCLLGLSKTYSCFFSLGVRLRDAKMSPLPTEL